MNKQERVIKVIEKMSKNQIDELVFFLEDAYKTALEDAESAKWRVEFYSKAIRSIETGQQFDTGQNIRGDAIYFNPDDKEAIKNILKHSNVEFEHAAKILGVLEILTDLFEKDHNPFTLLRQATEYE